MITTQSTPTTAPIRVVLLLQSQLPVYIHKNNMLATVFHYYKIRYSHMYVAARF